MPANARIIYNNIVDRAIITASSASGVLLAANLKRNEKGEVWRSVGTTASLTALLPTAESIGGVALVFCNMTAAGTARVRLSTTGADLSDTGSYVWDSGVLTAIAAAPQAPAGWGATVLGANSFAYGGGACVRVWAPSHYSVRGIRLDLADAGNPAGYIEGSRFWAGGYWEVSVNPDIGLALSLSDSDVQYRNGAGDLVTEVGTRHRKMSLRLSEMPEADRAILWGMLCSNGRAIPILISIYPGQNNKAEEAHQMLCKLVSMSSVSATSFIRYGAPLELEEI